jgi:hypothetical protein
LLAMLTIFFSLSKFMIWSGGCHGNVVERPKNLTVQPDPSHLLTTHPLCHQKWWVARPSKSFLVSVFVNSSYHSFGYLSLVNSNSSCEPSPEPSSILKFHLELEFGLEHQT